MYIYRYGIIYSHNTFYIYIYISHRHVSLTTECIYINNMISYNIVSCAACDMSHRSTFVFSGGDVPAPPLRCGFAVVVALIYNIKMPVVPTYPSTIYQLVCLSTYGYTYANAAIKVGKTLTVCEYIIIFAGTHLSILENQNILYCYTLLLFRRS